MTNPRFGLFILMAIALASGLSAVMITVGYMSALALAVVVCGSFLVARPMALEAIRVIDGRD